jgi:hypothetical protein
MANSNMISGIHNWCDRWCERCPFVSRCAVGAADAALPSEAKDMNNEAFWKALSDSFAKAFEMLDKVAKEQGIDIDSFSEEELEESKREWEEASERAEKHPICRLGMDYINAGRQWLESDAVKDQLEAALKEVEMGIRSIADGEREGLQIQECLEVIQWYLHFISVKSHRAVTEIAEEDEYDLELPPSKRSYNGTAKITLISIERSVNAWALLMDMMPGQEDDILSLLAMLQRLQRMIEAEFPDARSFIRPGFDTRS